MLVLLFLKVPVFISVLGGSLVYFLLNPDINSVIFAQQMILGTEKISLLAIPFFVCAGIVMNYTGVTKRIMDFCEVVTAHLPGGLAQVNVLLSTVMGGLSGSNLADAAMEAKMLIPEMTRKGFSLSFSSVVTAASSMITPLIPPGIAMILYGCIANVSIGKLFVSGIGVGGLLCISMMILVGVISKKRHYGKLTTEKLTGERVKKALKPAILPLLLPIIIIGGIRVGAFTATEAGAVAIIYAIFLGFLYRDMKAKDLVASLKETVASTSSIMLIVSAASVYSWILTRERVPQTLTEWMLQTIDNKFVFLIAVNIFCGTVRHQRNPVRHDLHLQQCHRRPVASDGYADVRHVLHFEVPDGGLHQGRYSVLHHAGGRPDPDHLLRTPDAVPGQPDLLIECEEASSLL